MGTGMQQESRGDIKAPWSEGRNEWEERGSLKDTTVHHKPRVVTGTCDILHGFRELELKNPGEPTKVPRANVNIRKRPLHLASGVISSQPNRVNMAKIGEVWALEQEAPKLVPQLGSQLCQLNKLEQATKPHWTWESLCESSAFISDYQDNLWNE